jgi:hypothetical protein
MRYMINYKNASKRIKKAAAIAVIAVFAQPSATGHPLWGMVDALNAMSGGSLVGQDEFGGLAARVTFEGIQSAAATAYNIVECDRHTLTPNRILHSYLEYGAKEHHDGKRPESANYVETVALFVYSLLSRIISVDTVVEAEALTVEARKQRDKGEALYETAIKAASGAKLTRLAEERDSANAEIDRMESGQREMIRSKGAGLQRGLDEIYNSRNICAIGEGDKPHNARTDVQLYRNGLKLDMLTDMMYDMMATAENMEREMAKGLPWEAAAGDLSRLEGVVGGHKIGSELYAGLRPIISHVHTLKALLHRRHLDTANEGRASMLCANAVRAYAARLAQGGNHPDVTLPMSALRIALSQVREQLRKELTDAQQAWETAERMNGWEAGAGYTCEVAEGNLISAREALASVNRAIESGSAVDLYLTIRDQVHRESEAVIRGRYEGSGIRSDDEEGGADGDGFSSSILNTISINWNEANPSEIIQTSPVRYNGEDACRDKTRVSMNLSNRCQVSTGRVRNTGRLAPQAMTIHCVWYPEIVDGDNMIQGLNLGPAVTQIPDQYATLNPMRRYIDLPALPAFVVRRTVTPADPSHRPKPHAEMEIARAFQQGRGGEWEPEESGNDYVKWRLWMTIHGDAASRDYVVQSYEEEPQLDHEGEPILTVPSRDSARKLPALLAIYQVHEADAKEPDAKEPDVEKAE